VTQSGCCHYCKRSYLRSIYRPQQVVCSQPECQGRRRTDYHRQKLRADSEYRQVVRESQKQRRQKNPVLVENNRQRQRGRDRKRRIERLVRNNLALNLKQSVSEVWLLGPKVRDLDKNNLASAQVLILPSVGHLPADVRAS
jgi:hypothetical protein